MAHAPSVRVVHHRPGRRALLIALLGAIGIGLAIGGYQLGGSHTARRLAEASELERGYAEAKERLAELERRVADAELASSVDGATQERLRQTIKSLRDELANDREELRFYRQLMAPSEAERGLRVEHLDLTGRPGDQVVKYRLLLSQVVDRHDWIQGNLSVDVVGVRQNEEQVLSLTEIAQIDAYPLSFRFRYFQDFTGSLTLPEDFSPTKVVVVAETGGKGAKRVERTFGWTLEEG